MAIDGLGIVEHIPDAQTVWFVSDLHLGDGTPSDVFFGKDKHLMALVRRVEREGAVLVVVGDAMDFHQAWTFTRIMRAHQELLGAMSRLARDKRLIYVIGNHDYDISLYREILNFRVCEELRVGDRILVQHGYQYDPYIGTKLHGSHIATKIHHTVERYLGTWLRIPLGEFYTLGNRISFWLTHKIALGLHALAWLSGKERALDTQLNYWARGNMGDPMCIFEPIRQRIEHDTFETIVCGHSHLPGIVPIGDRRYCNTGSWTFSSSQYLRWDGHQFSCRDWITGREFGAEMYAPVLDGSLDERDFWTWWRENYMGWFRFRQGEERRGRLRGWESYVRDHQYMGQLEPLDTRPLASHAAETDAATTEARTG
jgi:UDP-2,3-diacylglucosamine pyrophosphatase LpxH